MAQSAGIYETKNIVLTTPSGEFCPNMSACPGGELSPTEAWFSFWLA